MTKVEIINAHDSGLDALVVKAGTFSAELSDVTGYVRRPDHRYDHVRFSGELHANGVTQLLSRGDWSDEFVLDIKIHGRSIFEWRHELSEGIRATSISFDFIDALVSVQCQGPVRFQVTSNF